MTVFMIVLLGSAVIYCHDAYKRTITGSFENALSRAFMVIFSVLFVFTVILKIFDIL